MKCIYIYNPNSGRGIDSRKLNYIVSTLKKKYDVVDVVASKSSQDLTQIAQKACKEYDAIIFSGGDGTFNDVARGVSSEPHRPPLGYIPMGTGNDNARNLKIKINVRKALKTILQGKTMMHDVGVMNGHYFMYVAGVGVCTATSYTTKQSAKKLLGRLAYVRDGLDEFFNTPVSYVKVTTENEIVEMASPLLLVMNSKGVGGIQFNRYGHLNDGTFDIIIIKDDPTKGRMNILSTFINGLLGYRWKKSAVFLRSREFTVEVGEHVTWVLDGQKGPDGVATFHNLQEHLEIFVPKGKKKGK